MEEIEKYWKGRNRKGSEKGNLGSERLRKRSGRRKWIKGGFKRWRWRSGGRNKYEDWKKWFKKNNEENKGLRGKGSVRINELRKKKDRINEGICR